MVNSIVKFTVIIDFVLSILVPAPCCKSYHFFLFFKRSCIFEKPMNDQIRLNSLVLFLIIIWERTVEWSKYHRFFWLVSKCLINRIQIKFSKAVPRLNIIVNCFRSIWNIGVIINKFSFYNVFFFLIENFWWICGNWSHPWVFEDVSNIDSCLRINI